MNVNQTINLTLTNTKLKYQFDFHTCSANNFIGVLVLLSINSKVSPRIGLKLVSNRVNDEGKYFFLI
jgi:hypothetical protein